MRLIPPELTSAILTALGIGGAWLATLLGRRGHKEDTRIAERTQAFDELVSINERQADEIKRLTAERDASTVDRERLRESWEARWDRQMDRCRTITNPLVESIALLRVGCTPEAERNVVEALRSLAQHNERDHNGAD